MLGLVIFPAVLFPVVLSVLFQWHFVRGIWTVFVPYVWVHLWPLGPLMFFLSLAASWRVTSRALGIPMLNLSKWFKPLEEGQRSPSL